MYTNMNIFIYLNAYQCVYIYIPQCIPIGIYLYTSMYTNIQICIYLNVYQYIYIPECMPIRNFSVSFGLCLILKDNMADNSLSDMEAISPAWLSSLRIGSPLTTK